MGDIELLHKKLLNFNFFPINYGIIFFSLSLIFFTTPAYADNLDIEMDWLIEGQINQEITSQESQIVSSYDELIQKEDPAKPIYDKFITNNEYSIGDYKITIESEEGQLLNGMLVEQKDLREDSFKHKIKYYDRFSDGYIEIAEALLDPIGDSRYIIQGRSYDYNPNSNLELFVLERGHSMDNLAAIPNDIFSPKEFTLGRQLMEDAMRSGDGSFDLRDYSPNHLILTKEQIQERMMNALTEQTSDLFNDIMSGENLRHGALNNPEIGISQQQDSRNMFDNFKFEQSKFENTRHIRDSLQSKPIQLTPPSEDVEYLSSLLIVTTLVGLIVFAYFMRQKFFERKPIEIPIQVSEPQIDFRQLTQDMLNKSKTMYENNNKKEAYEVLSQAIRYYYSQSMGIYKEMTNLELLTILNKSKRSEYNRVRDWLLLCGSVEYAKYDSNDDDFNDALSKFTKEIL